MDRIIHTYESGEEGGSTARFEDPTGAAALAAACALAPVGAEPGPHALLGCGGGAVGERLAEVGEDDRLPGLEPGGDLGPRRPDRSHLDGHGPGPVAVR